MNLKNEFPFINHNKLRTLVYSGSPRDTIKIGNTRFDRHTYVHNQRLVLDTLARDPDALKIVGHLRKLINRQRAQYYPYFNRTLSKKEIQELQKAKPQ